MTKQTDFSQFYKLSSIPWMQKEDLANTVEHPFVFFEYFLNDLKSLPNFSEFESAKKFFDDIKSNQLNAYNCFELELSLSKENRILYLNKIVSVLLKIQKDLRLHKRKKELSYRSFENIFLILLNSVKEILKSIFISYHLELNNRNREALSKWFYLKKTITSFRFNTYPEDKRLEKLYYKYLVKGRFISGKVKFSTFKCLFEGKQLENKINWTDRKSSLYYFIKLLIGNNIIKNPKNRHWEIASEFFLLKGESLLPRDFLNQKETQNKKSRHIIESFVSALTV